MHAHADDKGDPPLRRGILNHQADEGESFSDVIIRIARKTEQPPLTEFVGKWAGNDIDNVFQPIFRERETARARETTP